MKKANIFLYFLCLLLIYTPSFAIYGISERLQKELNTKPDTSFLRVNAVFKDQLKLSQLLINVQGKPRREWRKINLPILKMHSEKVQSNVLHELRWLEANGEVRNIRVNWMGNEINFEATVRELKTFFYRFPELKSLDLDPDYSYEEILDALPSLIYEPPQINTVSWGVMDIQAPQLWAQGYTGQGILIATIDTGVERTHPALASRIWNNIDEIPNNNLDDDQNGYIDDTWGWNFELNNNNPIPGQAHGTNTAGILVGVSLSDTTGVAIGATLMVIRANSEGSYRLSLQYAVANGADVISSSMSYKYPNAPDYEQMRVMTDMELANGVIHANSIGNQGNSLSTYPIPFNIATPGNCPAPWLHPTQTLRGGISAVMGCGAYQQNLVIANYSGRGPAAWDSIMSPSRPPLRIEYRDYPYRNGLFQGLLKPDVSMPTDVRTTTVNGGYINTFNGTSASTPHLGGAMALLLSAVPDATPMDICEAIKMTTDTTNIGLQPNLYGTGRVRLVPALNYLFSIVDGGVIRGYVRDSITNQGIPNATLFIPNSVYSTTTDSIGTFIFSNVREGIWNLQVSASRYITRTLTNIAVDSADTITLNISLISPRVNFIHGDLVFHSNQGDSTAFDLIVQNSGFDTLRWQLSVVSSDSSDTLENRWTTLQRIPISVVTNDNRIYGVEFAYDHLWLAGGNNNAEPNYIYKLSRDGLLINSFVQPRNTSIYGIRDLTFDGTHFWGTDNNIIYRFDTTGTVVDSLVSQINPVRAIAYDEENQHFYYCDIRTPIFVVNRNGQLLRQLQHPLSVWGLSWYANDPDGMPLYIFSQDSTPSRLISKMNPMTGQWRPLWIPPLGTNQIAGGLCVVPNWGFGTDVILAVNQSISGADTLEVLKFRSTFNWLELSQTQGQLFSNFSDTIRLTIRTTDVPVGTWFADLLLRHNAPQPNIRRTLVVTINPTSNREDDQKRGIPSTFDVIEMYPNPFNSSIVFLISLPHTTVLKFSVFDVVGRQLHLENLHLTREGLHRIQFSNEQLSSGIYFFHFETNIGSKIKKGILIK
ncbi:MAG: S8 family serine peptidase [bacterium]|nr:S8 family serine peptidase [bacterium]